MHADATTGSAPYYVPLYINGASTPPAVELEKAFRFGVTLFSQSIPSPIPSLSAQAPSAPHDFQNLQNRALDYYHKGEWEAYINICRQLHDCNPRDIEVIRGLIKGNMELKRHKQVVHYTSELLALNPADVAVRVSTLKKRCQAYWNDNQSRNAMLDMVALLQINPLDQEVWCWGYNATNPPHLESVIESEVSDSPPKQNGNGLDPDHASH